jgi:hypothetical protein
MYESVIGESYREADSILDESDASDIDMDEFRSRRDSSSPGVTSSIRRSRFSDYNR